MKRKALQIAMVRKGISGNELTEKTGIARSKVSWIINGHWNPTSEEMDKIAGVLGCDRQEVFGREIA